MTLAGVKTMLETTGMPVVYGAWKKGTAPPMPYIVYLCTYNNNFRRRRGVSIFLADMCK